MEENATSTKGPGILVTCPNALITSTIRVTPSTRRFIKTISALTGIPILARGKSRLDEIAYMTKKAGFTSFLVVFSYKGQPSRIDLYSLRPEGFFERLGQITIRGFEILANPPACVGTELLLIGNNEVSRNLWRILTDAFRNDDCSKYHGGRLSTCKINDEDFESVVCFWWKEKLLVKILVKNASYLRER